MNVASGGEFIGRDKIVHIHEAPAPIATSLHQLPPPPRDFTGREAELAELLSKAETDGATISGLQGMGGVGKTALALVLAERLKQHYPDAQFYLDLKGVDKQPMSVTAALAHVIRAYYPTAKLPDSEAELRGLYLSVLEGQRALLLMDNAADKTQVEPLIPPSSCFLLVTSRQHFTLPGPFVEDLNTLTPYDARDLLLKIAPRIADQAEAMAKLCGYLPLALRLAGSAMAERQVLTPLGYLNRLKDAQPRLELVEASLGLSYDLLSEELQQEWCELAVFPDTFDVAAAAAVWDIEENLAQDRLDELIRYSLVEWNEVTTRARLHDLARLFTDKRLSYMARMDSQRRHAAHYQTASAAADWLYRQGGAQLMQGLALFDLEWVNIQTGHAWATQYVDADTKALSLCELYPARCAHILHLRQHPLEGINWLETALIAVRKLDRKGAECAHLANLGSAYGSLGEYRRAIEYHEQALAIAREIGNRHGEGAALGNLGNAYQSLGEYRHAIECHEQALAIDLEINNRQGMSRSLGGLGIAYGAFGEHRHAVEYFDQSLTIACEIGDQRGEGQALGNLGSTYGTLGEYRHAVEYFKQALTIAHEINDRQSEGTALNNLGLAHGALGEYRQSVEYHEQSLTIAREIGDRQGESIAVGNLGLVYTSLSEYHRAFEYYEQQLTIARMIGYRHGEATAQWGLALCFDAVDDRPQAVAHAQSALEIFIAMEAPQAQTMRDLLAKWRHTE